MQYVTQLFAEKVTCFTPRYITFSLLYKMTSNASSQVNNIYLTVPHTNTTPYPHEVFTYAQNQRNPKQTSSVKKLQNSYHQETEAASLLLG